MLMALKYGKEYNAYVPICEAFLNEKILILLGVLMIKMESHYDIVVIGHGFTSLIMRQYLIVVELEFGNGWHNS